RLIAALQMHAGVEQHRGILPVAHAESLGAREPGQRDFARRCLPGAGMRLLPAEMAPTRARIERRPVIVADAEGHKARAAVPRHRQRLPLSRVASGVPVMMGFASLNPSYGDGVVGWVERGKTHLQTGVSSA